MKTIWIATATGMLVSSAAMAQTAVTPAPLAAPATQAQTHASDMEMSGGNLRQKVKIELQQAGFTDVTMMPDSYLVQAKDKSGSPVMMMIKPNSVTELVDLGAAAPSHSGTAGGTVATVPAARAGAAGDQMGTAGRTFTTVPADERLSSKMVGLDVYNNANQDIGTIKDVAYDGSAIKAYIVGVGGFLGMDDHYVAVNPSSVHITYDANSKTWHAAMNTTADQLKAAPEFKYPSQT
jgi:hypothetical protein